METLSSSSLDARSVLEPETPSGEEKKILLSLGGDNRLSSVDDNLMKRFSRLMKLN